jgi:hypothetical protein
MTAEASTPPLRYDWRDVLHEIGSALGRIVLFVGLVGGIAVILAG